MFRILLLLALLCAPAQAGTLGTLNAGSSGKTAVSGFTGFGDTQAAYAHWGLAAYTAATRGSGNRVANVCDNTGGVDVACADYGTDSTTGIIESKVVGGITCPGNTNCHIKILYDTSGNTNCSGLACDLTRVSIATSPQLLSSRFGSLPAIVFSAASSEHLGSPAVSLIGAQSLICVGKVATFNSASIMSIDDGSVKGILLRAESTPAWRWITGGGGSVTGSAASTATPYAVTGTANTGANNVILYVNGSSQGTSTSTSINSGPNIQMGNDPFGNYDGDATECGLVSSVLNSTQVGSITTTVRTIWGF